MQAQSSQEDNSRSRRLPRPVLLLGTVSLLTDISSEMLYPLIPIFLTAVLGAPVAALGVIEGVAEGGGNILKTVSGWWSDRTRRRKPFVIGGYSLSAVAKPALALASGWPFVFLLRALDRAGKGLRTSARDALIADYTHPAQRGRAYGLHRAMDSLGAVLGPLAALFFMSRLGDAPHTFRTVFLWAFLPAALGVVVLFVVRDKSAGATRERPRLRWNVFGGEFKAFLGVSALFAAGNSSDAFLILRARGLFHSAANATAVVILVYALYNLTYSLGSYPAGVVTDRIGPRKVFGAGLFVFAAVYAGFAFNESAGLAWPLFAVYGLYTALTDGVGKAYASRLIPESHRATGLGVYHMVQGLATVAASALAGLLWQRFGYRAAFLYGAACAAAALLLFIALSGRLRREYA